LRRTKFLTTLFFVAVFHLFNQSNSKEQQSKVTVQQIIDGFSKQDSSKISKFIDKKQGVYLLHRIGVFDTYEHFKTITFSDPTYPQILFTSAKRIRHDTLQYAAWPAFDCGQELWSKKGLFVDTTRTDHIVSEICKSRNENRPDTISAKTIQFFYNLENKSRRIVLNDANEKDLVFYLSYLNGKWYLTIIDSVSSDCS